MATTTPSIDVEPPTKRHKPAPKAYSTDALQSRPFLELSRRQKRAASSLQQSQHQQLPKPTLKCNLCKEQCSLNIDPWSLTQLQRPYQTSQNRHIHDLFTSSAFSDFEVISSERTFKVHRAILSQNTTFANLLKSQFQEAQSHAIDLKEENPHAVAALLAHFYSSSYAPKDADNDPVMHIEVFALAEKYGATMLKSMSALQFKACAQRIVVRAMQDARHFAQSTLFLQAVKRIYDIIPEHAQKELLEFALKLAAHYALDFNSRSQAQDDFVVIGISSSHRPPSVIAENRTLLSEMPNFAMDMAEYCVRLRDGSLPSLVRKKSKKSLKRKRTAY